MNLNLFNKILDSKTINLTTYRKSGDAVHTPVWVVTDGTLGYVSTSKDIQNFFYERAPPGNIPAKSISDLRLAK